MSRRVFDSRHLRSLSARHIRFQQHTRQISSTSARLVVKPFILSDIGEGIREVQIIQWFVQAGARVEQFDKICEVQSDKASVEITSRFDGVIKKLHYEADDMAEVGKALLDIDIQSDISPEDEALTTPPAEQAGHADSKQQPQKAVEQTTSKSHTDHTSPENRRESRRNQTSNSKSLATPAIRHLVKQHNLSIDDVEGTGKDGRVLKEDVLNHVTASDDKTPDSAATMPTSTVRSGEAQPDRTITLTATQATMFKTMTRSLSIPHFLYTDTIDVGPINKLRAILNKQIDTSFEQPKLTLLPFLVKALSQAMIQFPILTARVNHDSAKPQLMLRGSHNIGIACDTPQGLVVPVIKNVQAHSIMSIAIEANRLSALARDAKLKADDMTGGIFTVSNIGSIGGGVVSPIIVEGQLGILGVGRGKVVPAFDATGQVVRREEVTMSWSADHRIVDGATIARAAEHLRALLEEPGKMLVGMR